MFNYLQPNKQFASLKSVNRWLIGLMLLFVLSQTAGIVHAQIHQFHEHEESCDVFDNLGQPLDKATSFSLSLAKSSPQIPFAIELRSVFDAVYVSYFFGRAPPIA